MLIFAAWFSFADMEGPDGLKKVAEAFQLPIHGLNDLQPDRYVLYQTITDALLDQIILVKPSDVVPGDVATVIRDGSNGLDGAPLE